MFTSMTNTWAAEVKEKRCLLLKVSVNHHRSHGVRQGIMGEWAKLLTARQGGSRERQEE